MNKKEIESLALEAAKGIKTEQDLNDFRRMVTKITVEAALNAELDANLGYNKHESSVADNRRNDYSNKIVQTEDGALELNTPDDREGSFDP